MNSGKLFMICIVLYINTSLDSVVNLNALAFLLNLCDLQTLVLLCVLHMSSSTRTITCCEMHHSDQWSFKTLSNQSLLHSLFVGKHILDRGNALFYYIVYFLLNITSHSLNILYFPLVFNERIVFKMVPFGRLPFELYSIEKQLLNLCTARSIMCPAECSLACFVLTYLSISIVTSSPIYRVLASSIL